MRFREILTWYEVQAWRCSTKIHQNRTQGLDRCLELGFLILDVSIEREDGRESIV
jgi:hypothetical protein